MKAEPCTDGCLRYLVVQETGTYVVHTLYHGETWYEVEDLMDGSLVTIIKRGETTVNTTGRAAGEFSSIREARLTASRLAQIREVMDG